MIVGCTLSSLRFQRESRQKTLAYGLGIDPSQLSLIENKFKPPPRFAISLEKCGLLLELNDGEKRLLSNCVRTVFQQAEAPNSRTSHFYPRHPRFELSQERQHSEGLPHTLTLFYGG
ncbi:MAG: hypothetical protein H6R07_383 [Proteobacteria bacterium]|nr:hypothetical protein [Pseudomonadota bacterium]